MPIITVEGPPLPEIEKKRELAQRLTNVAVDIYGIRDIVVLIKENAPENVASEGELIYDRRRNLGER